MTFNLPETLDILECTPTVVSALLRGTGGAWRAVNEGPDTWSAFNVVGYLIHGEDNHGRSQDDSAAEPLLARHAAMAVYLLVVYCLRYGYPELR